jgi:hypothetical protein
MTALATTEDPLYVQIKQQPDLLAELNAKPARVTINGKRHYNTPFYTGPGTVGNYDNFGDGI